MASRISAGFRTFFGSCAVLLAPGPAFADEAFLCGPSEVVYVPADQIEFKKKTDPCVAAYFGLTVDPVAMAEAQGEVRGGKEVAATRAKRSPVSSFKTIDTPEKSARAKDGSSRAALLMPAEASPGTDFRNVKIINATPEGSQWFKHLR